VLSDPTLRALGPLSPIWRAAISPSPSAPPQAVAEDGARGFAVRAVSSLSRRRGTHLQSLRALSPRVDFLLACFREKNDTVNYAKLHEVFRDVRVLDRDEKASPDSSLSAAGAGALLGQPARADAEWKPDLLQIEFTHLAHFRDAAPQTPPSWWSTT